MAAIRLATVTRRCEPAAGARVRRTASAVSDGYGGGLGWGLPGIPPP
jgi:hypothetical protein